MTRYFLFLSYNGTGFHGWQIQPHAVTVQGELEKALGCLMHESVHLTGAGRTDTGVHAAYFTAHFDASRDDLAGDADWLRHLNGMLPRGILVSEVRAMPSDAHARFDALSRTYRYVTMRVPCPFAQSGWNHEYRELDVPLMQQGADVLRSYTDFTSFSKLHTDTKTNICHISDARFLQCDWAQTAPMLFRREPVSDAVPSRRTYPVLIFEITADRFLRNMVRAIVGTLWQVGLGRCSLDALRAVVEARNRCAAGTSMPADGLYLTDIRYPWDIPAGFRASGVRMS